MLAPPPLKLLGGGGGWPPWPPSSYAYIIDQLTRELFVRKPSYRPINEGTICAKVYPEGVQRIKGNNCGLIPYRR